MIFEYTDERNWKYSFTIQEDDLMFFELNCWTDEGKHVHKEEVVFFEDLFLWKEWHLRKEFPLISQEAIKYCEKSMKSFVKLKAFW